MGLYVIDAEGNRVLIAGSSGPAGADGKDGKSAYDYAVAGGYTGTEEEFQALLGTGPWIPTAGRLIGEYTEVFNQSVAAAKVGAYVKSHFEGGWHKISDQTDPDVECTHVEGFANAINAKVRAAYPGEIYGIHAEGSENLVDFEGSYYTNITLSPYSSDTVYTACGSGIHVEGYDNSVYGLPSGAHVDGQQWKEYMERYRTELANQLASTWAEKELGAAVTKGVTDGKRPRDLVTREEAAIMVMRSRG